MRWFEDLRFRVELQIQAMHQPTFDDTNYNKAPTENRLIIYEFSSNVSSFSEFPQLELLGMTHDCRSL